ncbi:MAG: hypothetical protein V3G42_05010 [Oscillospiraceae bacterium]
MSGPKVDTAAIRQQELTKLMNARQGRRELAEMIQKSIHEVEMCVNMQELQKSCKKELQKLLRQVKHGNELLDMESIRKTHTLIMQEFHGKMQSEQKRMESVKTAYHFSELQRESRKLGNAHQVQIRRMSETSAPKVPAISQKEVQQQYQAFSEEMTEFLNCEPMTGTHKNTILLLNHDLQKLEKSDIPLDEKSRKLQRLHEEYSKISMQIHNEMEYLSDAYEEYCQECFDSPIPLKAITDFSSLEEIQTAMEEAKELAKNQISREYIRRQIDDVMSQHGYQIVSSEQLEEADNHQVLYGVGDDTAIHVFVSDEQQVTMRVVGIGFDDKISAEEDEKLFQKQCAFCQMHPEITAELALRGVILQTRKHMPPDKRFNKKIRTRSGLQEHSGSRAKKQQKRQELKTMRKES